MKMHLKKLLFVMGIIFQGSIQPMQEKLPTSATLQQLDLAEIPKFFGCIVNLTDRQIRSVCTQMVLALHRYLSGSLLPAIFEPIKRSQSVYSCFDTAEFLQIKSYSSISSTRTWACIYSGLESRVAPAREQWTGCLNATFNELVKRYGYEPKDWDPIYQEVCAMFFRLFLTEAKNLGYDDHFKVIFAWLDKSVTPEKISEALCNECIPENILDLAQQACGAAFAGFPEVLDERLHNERVTKPH